MNSRTGENATYCSRGPRSVFQSRSLVQEQSGQITGSPSGAPEAGAGSQAPHDSTREVADEPVNPIGNAEGLEEGALRAANLHPSMQTISSGPRPYTLPLVVASGHPVQQGFVRIINHSDWPGVARIHAIDDAGRSFGPITLSLPEKASRHFNSNDLERGNSPRLSVGVGNGTGNWRLRLESDVDIEPFAYVRTLSDQFVTTMQDTVAGDQNNGYKVPFFNDGYHLNQSHLRIVNIGYPTTVVIDAVDDRGRPAPGGQVRFHLPSGQACRISARELESGSPTGGCRREFSGRLGDGTGKWHLSITAGGSLTGQLLVMNLMTTPSGHLTNLSTSPARISNILARDLWGAYAVKTRAQFPRPPGSECQFAWALTSNRPSARDALNRADAACGGACLVRSFQQCAAVAQATWHGARGRQCIQFPERGSTKSEVERAALSNCRRQGFSDCAIAVNPSGVRASVCNSRGDENAEPTVLQLDAGERDDAVDTRLPIGSGID